MKQKISITIEDSILSQVDGMIDNLYIRNRSQAFEYLASKALGDNRSAVILCGGEESNLHLSGDIYAVNAKLGNLYVIEKAVKKLRENNFKNIYIVAREKILTRIFEILKEGSRYGVKINYVEEKVSKGSADSLRLLKGKITGNFLVVYGDLIFDKVNIDNLWNDHIKGSALATIMMTTSNEPSKKGTLKVEGSKVIDFTQKPSESDIYLVFSPIFVCDDAIFDLAGSSIEYDLFPKIAKRGLLNGHLSSEKEQHIHKLEDLRH